MSKERWRDIPGYPNYQVSNFGRVRRGQPGKGTLAGKIRIPYATPRGYLAVDMWHNGIRTKLYVHQAVLLAFRGPPPTIKHQGAHWNRDVTNNKLTNLHWKTPKANDADKDRHGTRVQGSKHCHAKLTEAKVKRMRKLRATGRYTLQQIGDMFGVTLTNADLVCRGVTWRHVHA